MKFYIATRRQENARPVRDAIEALGHTCTATWIDVTDYGKTKTPENDRDPQQRIDAAAGCVHDVLTADVLISVSEPDGEKVKGGKHAEFGMALAWGKQLIVMGDREHVFHWLPNVKVVKGLPELVAYIKEMGDVLDKSPAAIANKRAMLNMMDMWRAETAGEEVGRMSPVSKKTREEQNPPRHGCMTYFLAEKTDKITLLTKGAFDILVNAKRFKDGPFTDSFGDGPGEPYNPRRQAYGTLDTGMGVYCELTESNRVPT